MGPRILGVAVLSCALAGTAPGQSLTDPPRDLDSVLDRASAYVVAYEEQLGTLIGEEEYHQELTVISPAGVAGRPGRGFSTFRRRLDSDFLLVPVEDSWLGVRNVRRVDGVPIDNPEDLSPDITTSREVLLGD